MRWARLFGAALVLLAGAAAGCAAEQQGHGNGPFTPPPCTSPDCGTSWMKSEAVTHRIYDVEITYLHNYSRQPVRLTSVRIISPASGLRTLNVRAYGIYQSQPTGNFDEGDLAKLCPESYKPHPVTDVTFRPGKGSRWVVIIEVVFERPGRYHFRLGKVSYLSGGRRGWQYFPLPDLRIKTVPVKTAPHLYYPGGGCRQKAGSGRA
jgi:hypothetical protein